MSELTDELPSGRGGATSGAPGSHVECAYVHDLTAGFAFGALDSDEHHLIEQHCFHCPPCAHVLDLARQTATLLSFVAPALRPPAHVKATLFTRIAHSSRFEPATVPAIVTPAIAAPIVELNPAPFRPAAGIRASGARQRRSLFDLSRTRRFLGSQRLPRWQSIAVPLATVPLVVALAIVGGFAVTAQSRVSDLRHDLSLAQGEAERLQSTVDAMDGFVRTEDAMVYRLPSRGVDASSDSHGKVVVNPGTTDAMLLVWGLAPSAGGAGYQVFLEHTGGNMVAAGQFHVDADGRGGTVLDLEQPFTSYESVHVKSINRTQFGQNGDALAATIDPNVGELLDTDQPQTR